MIRDAIAARARFHYGRLNPFRSDSWNNHPWFNTTAMAEGALAVFDEVPEAREWASYALQLYLGRFISHGGRDGDWHEGSNYWSYSLQFVLQFADVMRSATGIDIYRHPWMRSTPRWRHPSAIYHHLRRCPRLPGSSCRACHSANGDASRSVTEHPRRHRLGAEISMSGRYRPPLSRRRPLFTNSAGAWCRHLATMTASFGLRPDATTRASMRI